MRRNEHTNSLRPVENREDSTFTGTVWAEVLLPFEHNSSANRVTFASGARTFWHRHDGGQVLIGQAGAGLVVTRDGDVAEIGEGVVVHGTPGEEHWHGALPGAFLTHVSVVMGGATEWLEEVSDEDYARAVGDDEVDGG